MLLAQPNGIHAMIVLEDASLYLVRWRCQGARFIGGMAYPRVNGDEDIMPTQEARTHVQCRQVDIVRKLCYNEPKGVD